MKYLALILLIVSVFSFNIPADTIGDDNKVRSGNLIATCPADNADNKLIVKGFLTAEGFQHARAETGTNHLTPSQIQVLEDPEDSSVCSTFINEIGENYTKVDNNDDLVFRYAFYRAGNYYFTTRIPRDPAGERRFRTGVLTIGVYDSNLNYIGGYFF